ncbi:amastin-like surface protein-like protein [Trypanosoma grayi]|uniref:amastin-like surface protein-like protein n=1 Tax=Trypanosoma grayi TaxID=71804 RepID=UPI0004F45813|nr:amastin-like surface protein-like protein [Trypanosoma grayi]KEG12145.1 amastin-like surface protein-like protein [Trypanosoma grayi]
MSTATVPEVYRESFRFRPEPAKPKTFFENMWQVLFCVLSFVSFVLTLVATPIDVYRDRGSSACVTMWGSRRTCGTNEYTPTDWGCADRENHIDAARAFSILSIILTFGSFVLGALLIARLFVYKRIIPAVISLGATMTLVLTWGCLAGVYHQKLCDDDPLSGVALRETHTYGVGFGLFVAAFCVQLITTVVELFI